MRWTLLVANYVVFSGCLVVSHPGRDSILPEDYDVCQADDECVVAELSCGATNGFRISANRNLRADLIFPYAEVYNIERSGDITCISDVGTACIMARCELVLLPAGTCGASDETCAPGHG